MESYQSTVAPSKTVQFVMLLLFSGKLVLAEFYGKLITVIILLFFRHSYS